MCVPFVFVVYGAVSSSCRFHSSTGSWRPYNRLPTRLPTRRANSPMMPSTNHLSPSTPPNTASTLEVGYLLIVARCLSAFPHACDVSTKKNTLFPSAIRIYSKLDSPDKNWQRSAYFMRAKIDEMTVIVLLPNLKRHHLLRRHNNCGNKR